MITRILIATGRLVVSFGAALPLGDRLLDARYSDDEGEHLMWGLGAYAGLILGAISLFAWRH
ncbi:hypothetical protein [Caulobacter soli]|uniref:hypothetical protein n=1 Tax=Caulobacter soli TaxID=2708539 RepID=UPI0013EC5BBA|nr:hypothetical protein [Caulobacter soli]